MCNKKRSFYLPFLTALVMVFTPLQGRAQDELEIYPLGGNNPVDFNSEPTNPFPVLFVHGHNTASDTDSDFNYKKNWVTTLNGQPSFDIALARNGHLEIEPYYIRFRDQNRSIEDDAKAIEQAVDMILKRHGDPEAEQIKVVIIGFSKGTISSRLYLKEHWAQKKVSEFIAIAPPNHGLNSLAGSQSLKQLNNGYTPICRKYGSLLNLRSCTDDAYRECDFDRSTGCPDDFTGCDFNHPLGHHFIECLNGHSLCDTKGSEGAEIEQDERFSGEAPGSRSADENVREGILYLVLAAEDNDDFLAGGETLSGDCLGRKLGKNLAPDAVNRWFPVKGGIGNLAVHPNTPHTPQIICQALYTAAYHKVPEASLRCQLDADDVPLIPAPPAANAMLALDLSGSMGGYPCPDCGPKVDYLREAVELFIELWGVVARPQDRIGAVYFRDQAEPFLVGDKALGPVVTHGEAIHDDLNEPSQEPSGMTAMGGALHTAISTLRQLPAVEGDARHVVLFSDGMQNRNPMVVETDDGKLIITDYPSKHPLPTELAPIDLGDIAGIKVNTIGVGVGDPFKEMLEKIADHTGGSFTSSFGVEDLRLFFIEKVIDVMRGFSPQLVSYRRGATGPDKFAIERFAIESDARRVIFLAHIAVGGELDLEVEKDGHVLTDLAQRVHGSFYRILAFDLPLEVDGTTIESGGEWHLMVQNRAGGNLAYEAAAIVDGAEVSHEASLNATVAGRPLEMEVRLSAGSQPLTGATVSARVLRTGTAMGTLLATTSMPTEPILGLEPETTGGEKKLQALIVQDEVWADIKPLEPLGARVALTDQGDGTYRGSYDQTSIPGTYKVIFGIRGTDTVGREYRRSETLSTQVEVGELLFKDLYPAVSVADRSTELTTLELTIRPRDSYGNYLGPDYGDRIRVTLADGSVAPVVDRLDGGYAITFSVPADEDPNLELAVLGRRLFSGPVSELPPPEPVRIYRWTLSGHLGLTLPTGILDRFYDPGALAELDLEYAVSPRFALHGVIGRYRFDPDYDIDGATLYLRAYRPWKSPAHRPGSTRLFAEIGPGVYDPDGLGSTAGASAGFGVVRAFRPRLESELGVSYFHLFNSGDDLRFTALKAGLRYAF